MGGEEGLGLRVIKEFPGKTGQCGLRLVKRQLNADALVRASRFCQLLPYQLAATTTGREQQLVEQLAEQNEIALTLDPQLALVKPIP
jgi:hypothetical protein